MEEIRPPTRGPLRPSEEPARKKVEKTIRNLTDQTDDDAVHGLREKLSEARDLGIITPHTTLETGIPTDKSTT